MANTLYGAISAHAIEQDILDKPGYLNNIHTSSKSFPDSFLELNEPALTQTALQPLGEQTFLFRVMNPTQNPVSFSPSGYLAEHATWLEADYLGEPRQMAKKNTWPIMLAANTLSCFRICLISEEV